MDSLHIQCVAAHSSDVAAQKNDSVLIDGKPLAVRHRFQKAIEGNAQVNVSTIASFKPWYGVENSEQKTANTTVKTGRPVGAYDLLRAGQAVRHKMALVTANSKEFGRIKGLLWEDWAKSYENQMRLTTACVKCR